MSRTGEEHSASESGPPGGLVDVLRGVEARGGQWRVVTKSDAWITFDLSTGDDQTSRIHGARTSVLNGFLAGRTCSED